MKPITTEDIQRLQENLFIIRSVAEWKAEELGEMLGLTKQSISNIEHGKTNMTKAQYIAIRALIDQEIKDNPNSQTLEQVVHLLLDTEDLNEKEAKIAEEIHRTIKNTNKSRIETASAVFGVVSGLISAGVLIPIATTFDKSNSWLKELIKSAKQTK